jgi:hypothetical protein
MTRQNTAVKLDIGSAANVTNAIVLKSTRFITLNCVLALWYATLVWRVIEPRPLKRSECFTVKAWLDVADRSIS